MEWYCIAVERITYYEIKAPSEEEAIERVLEQQGTEVDQELIRAYAVEGD